MELLLWLQTIAFFAQVFDMARAQLGFSTWILVISEMLNLSDSHSIFYISNYHLIYTFCKDYNQPSFIIEGKLRQKFPVQNHLHSCTCSLCCKYVFPPNLFRVHLIYNNFVSNWETAKYRNARIRVNVILADVICIQAANARGVDNSVALQNKPRHSNSWVANSD